MTPALILLTRVLKETDPLLSCDADPLSWPTAHHHSCVEIHERLSSERLVLHTGIQDPELPGKMLRVPEIRKRLRFLGGKPAHLHEGESLHEILLDFICHIREQIDNHPHIRHFLLLRSQGV